LVEEQVNSHFYCIVENKNKKRAAMLRSLSETFGVGSSEIYCRSEFLSKKYAVSKKISRKSEVI
jgi:hypothetical protein